MCGKATVGVQQTLPVYISDAESQRYGPLYRANPFTRKWEYWTTSGWQRSYDFAKTPITQTGVQIVRRYGNKIESYERTWAEPVGDA